MCAALASQAISNIAGLFSIRLVITPSIFLVPFAPLELSDFTTNREPLTPARVSRPQQVSLLHVLSFLIVPTPTTPRWPELQEFVFSVPV
jgi:hypothetical protein